VSSGEADATRKAGRLLLLGGFLAAGLAGAFASRFVIPRQRPSAEQSARPIVQIVRQQPGLPDLSDMIDRLCPSVAVILPHGSDPPTGVAEVRSAAHAFAVSADGWLFTSAAALPSGQLDAIFGDGTRVDLAEIRTDPVSGLAIVKANGAAEPPLAFNDQAFPRVGQFGLALATPFGKGCSANAAMIASDFLADGGGTLGYVRLQSTPDVWTGGMPFLGTDGRVLGTAVTDPAGAIIPAPIAVVIVDELIRNSLSPSTGFGFRAVDYGPSFSSRLGNVRSGAGVALVQPKSGAARAGLRAGDIVTAVNNVPVSSASELSRALDAVPGAATLTSLRASQQLEFTITRTSGE
jgi:serine protease Do